MTESVAESSETISLESILKSVADNAITNQRDNGAFPPGHNGPHSDLETPVRNTSHYLILLSKLYQRTKNEKYLESCLDAVSYLGTKEARPYGHTFHHRKSDQKDSCNGIMGQAWTIESIAEAGRVIDIPELIGIAEEVFLHHPFDERLGIWKRVGVDGTTLCFDSTLNHQVWFAAAGGLLSKYHDVDNEVDRRVERFLNRFETNLAQYESGLIRSLVRPPIKDYPYAAIEDQNGRLMLAILATDFPLNDSNLFRNAILDYTPISRLPSPSHIAIKKAAGYQSFHLYGYSLLKRSFPNHQVWDGVWLSNAWDYAHSQEFIDVLEKSDYGYPYNVAGIEMAYALEIFEEGNQSVQEEWLSRQFQKCWESNNNAMSRNNSDPITLTARVYEASRLSNYQLQIDISN